MKKYKDSLAEEQDALIKEAKIAAIKRIEDLNENSTLNEIGRAIFQVKAYKDLSKDLIGIEPPDRVLEKMNNNIALKTGKAYREYKKLPYDIQRKFEQYPNFKIGDSLEFADGKKGVVEDYDETHFFCRDQNGAKFKIKK